MFASRYSKTLGEVQRELESEGLRRGTIEFVNELNQRFIESDGRYIERAETEPFAHADVERRTWDYMSTSDVS